jgi:hypothetical protein
MAETCLNCGLNLEPRNNEETCVCSKAFDTTKAAETDEGWYRYVAEGEDIEGC